MDTVNETQEQEQNACALQREKDRESSRQEREIQRVQLEKYRVWRKKARKRACIISSISLASVLVVAVGGFYLVKTVIPAVTYSSAVNDYETAYTQGDYYAAGQKLLSYSGRDENEDKIYECGAKLFEAKEWEQCVELLGNCPGQPDSAEKILTACKNLKQSGDYLNALELLMKYYTGTDYAAAYQQIKLPNLVAAGVLHSAYVKPDGTAGSTRFASDTNAAYDGQGEVQAFSGIKEIAAGYSHTVGLKADGTVAVTPYTGAESQNLGQCDLKDFTDITRIVTGRYYTAAIKSDGTVVTNTPKGDSKYGDGPFKVLSFHDTVDLAAGEGYTVGLCGDGTLMCTQLDEEKIRDAGQRDIGEWSDIISIATGYIHTVGLKRDGTVVAVGDNTNGQCEVKDWKDIVAIAADANHTIGLKKDGTVVSTKHLGASEQYYGECEVQDWKDIVAVATGGTQTLGIKKDGTVVATVYTGLAQYNKGQCDVAGWKVALPWEKS